MCFESTVATHNIDLEQIYTLYSMDLKIQSRDCIQSTKYIDKDIKKKYNCA